MCNLMFLTININHLTNAEFNNLDSIEITIYAYNLSEDMSVFSTMNDEVIIQIYELSDKMYLEEPILSEERIFDEINRTSKIILAEESIKENNQYLLLITEYDYKKTDFQRNPVIRIHYKEIKEFYTKKDRTKLDEYLGSDELLGLSELTGKEIQEGIELTYEGYQNLEKYKYNISIK